MCWPGIRALLVLAVERLLDDAPGDERDVRRALETLKD